MPTLIDDESSVDRRTGVARSERRKAIVWSWLSIVGYVWDVIRNLIVVAVVLLIFGKLYEPFHVIAISILILIYLTLVGNSGSFGLLVAHVNHYVHKRFHEVLQRLGKEQSEDATIALEEDEFQMDKARNKILLNGFFSVIIYLIVLFNLFAAL